jgi:hypothetical protein
MLLVTTTESGLRLKISVLKKMHKIKVLSPVTPLAHDLRMLCSAFQAVHLRHQGFEVDCSVDEGKWIPCATGAILK